MAGCHVPKLEFGWGLCERVTMEKRRCLARLTNWDKTAERLAPCMTACRIVLCKNTREGDSPICEHCKSRPVDGKYQTRMIHGLLTEPIPEASRLYGGPWYWMQVDKHGEPTNKEWLAAAIASQEAAEEVVVAAGAKPWKVQRMGVKEIEMRKRKAEGAKAKAFAARAGASAGADGAAAAANGPGAAAVAAKVAVPAVAKKAGKSGTLLNIFYKVDKKYQEAAADPVMMETDSYRIRKQKVGDIEVWISENGMVFDCEDGGKIGEWIGRYVNEEFVEI
jgi:hypothetical protein